MALNTVWRVENLETKQEVYWKDHSFLESTSITEEEFNSKWEEVNGIDSGKPLAEKILVLENKYKVSIILIGGM